MITQMIKCVVIRTLVSQIVCITRRTHQIVRRTHGSVTRVGGWNPDHPIKVLLNILNKSLNNIDLSRTIQNQSFNRVVYLFFVLASVAHFKEFLLVGPSHSLLIRIRLVMLRSGTIIKWCWIRKAPPWWFFHVGIWCWITELLNLLVDNATSCCFISF